MNAHNPMIQMIPIVVGLYCRRFLDFSWYFTGFHFEDFFFVSFQSYSCYP